MTADEHDAADQPNHHQHDHHQPGHHQPSHHQPSHHQPSHHQHGHHQHDDGFDWEAMADRLELDAAIVAPIVAQAIDLVTATPVAHVIDAGSGPGAVTVALAGGFPDALVTALDNTPALVDRVTRSAEAAGVGHRVRALVGDLERSLPPTEPADVVWAGMVLHHVADPTETLGRLRDRLRPGGELVMIEFGRPPALSPADEPVQADGTWTRFQDATSATLRERLGLDPVTVDWPTLLASVGFTDVRDLHLSAAHEAPLADDAAAWFDGHVRRGVEMAGERLSEHDRTRLVALADAAPTRDDLGVVVHRRVLLARRT